MPNYETYEHWLRRQSLDRTKPRLEEKSVYIEDDFWGWRDKDEDPIENIVLEAYKLGKEDNWVVALLVFFIAGALAWGILSVVLGLIFNSRELSWRMPMDTGLIVLFALCGTVLGSVAMWCMTTYRLRMAQLRERKEIRQMEYDREVLKTLPGGKLTMREVSR